MHFSIDRLIDEKNAKIDPQEGRGSGAASNDMHREVVDDFIRNFLTKNGMKRTLESFQLS